MLQAPAMQRHMTLKAGGLRHASSSASTDAAHEYGLRRTASAVPSLLPASEVSEAPADGAEGPAAPAGSGEGVAATSAVERRWTRTSNGLGPAQGETWIVQEHCDRGCLQVRMRPGWQTCSSVLQARLQHPIHLPLCSSFACTLQHPRAASARQQHTPVSENLVDSSVCNLRL